MKKPQYPLWKYISTLDQEEQKLLITILPAAAEINRNGFERDISVNKALHWTIEVLERELSQTS